jgi:hypothetical protein
LAGHRLLHRISTSTAIHKGFTITVIPITSTPRSVHPKYQKKQHKGNHTTMPPLLKTYFNPHHRQFLSTLFTATFLGSVLVVAFPCPVRPKDGSPSLVNESPRNTVAEGASAGEGRRRGRDEIVVMMNERSGGRRRFMSED